MGDNRQSTVLLECTKCHRKYARIKNAMKTCGAVIEGVTCGGELKPIVGLKVKGREK
jgi:hypothetical protein